MFGKARFQRIGSRVLSTLGVTRRRHVSRLEDRLAVLEQQLVAARGDAARFHKMVLARDNLLKIAVDELAFRADSLAALTDATDSVPEMLWGVASPQSVLPSRDAGAVINKSFVDRPLISGLSARQALHLEMICLARLRQHAGSARRHFPGLVSVDREGMEIALTDQGQSLDSIPQDQRPAIARQLRGAYRDQLTVIVEALEVANVVHLDPHETGRNLTVAPDGTLSLIDFDIAVVDGQPFSATLARLHDRWVRRGGYRMTHRHLDQIVGRWLDAAA